MSIEDQILEEFDEKHDVLLGPLWSTSLPKEYMKTFLKQALRKQREDNERKIKKLQVKISTMVSPKACHEVAETLLKKQREALVLGEEEIKMVVDRGFIYVIRKSHRDSLTEKILALQASKLKDMK